MFNSITWKRKGPWILLLVPFNGLFHGLDGNEHLRRRHVGFHDEAARRSELDYGVFVDLSLTLVFIIQIQLHNKEEVSAGNSFACLHFQAPAFRREEDFVTVLGFLFRGGVKNARA